MGEPNRHPQGLQFPFVYIDNPPFGVADRTDLWVGSCTTCGGTHFLRRSSFPCCSNPECNGAYADAEVVALHQDGQAILLSTYFLGGFWAVSQLLNELERQRA